MTLTASTLLPLLLVLAGDGVEWLSETSIKVTATVAIDDPMEAFDKGGKLLDKVAKEACTSKDLDKAKIEGEAMLTSLGVSGSGKQHVTLQATYVCS